VRGFDRQAMHGLLAETNVRLYLSDAGLPADRFSAECADVSAIDWQPTAWQPTAWHADPDRRATGKRSTAIEFHDPPTEVLEHWLARQPSAAIKLAPAARLPDSWQSTAESEWISRGGECRQLVAWFGDLAKRVGEHVATILSTSSPPRHVSGQPQTPVPRTERIGRYVYEPDAAVLAAHLSGQLAMELELGSFSTETAYLTGDRPIVDAAAAGFEVIDVLPFQLKKLKWYLRQLRAGHVEVKKRGVTCDPLTLQKELSGEGNVPAVVLVTRHQSKSIAIVARRLPANPLQDAD